ncbi:MAG: hypothetical protein WA421_11295 [Nitrososphaeraceae archaeon]
MKYDVYANHRYLPIGPFPLSELAIDSKSLTIKPTSMLGLGLTLVLAGCRANTVPIAKNSVHSFVAFLTTD